MKDLSPKELFDVKDVKVVRELLLKEQKKLCALSKIPIPDKQAVLDHDHKTQRVRGVLHRQANACLGKIENLYVRYLSYWYPHSLQEFLRKSADYLDDNLGHKPTGGWYHPGWIKRVCTDFNSLKESGKIKVLESMNVDKGSNAIQRKMHFRKALLTKRYTYATIATLIKTQKDSK